MDTIVFKLSRDRCIRIITIQIQKERGTTTCIGIVHVEETKQKTFGDVFSSGLREKRTRQVRNPL